MKYEDTMMASFIKAIRLHYIRAHYLMDKIGVYPGQHVLLFILAGERINGLSQKEIASRMSVKPATLAVMIQRMENNHLLIKKVDENDKRISRVFITEQGMKTVDLLAKAQLQLKEECLVGFSHEEKIQFKNMLDRMSYNLQTVLDKSSVKNPNTKSEKGGTICHN